MSNEYDNSIPFDLHIESSSSAIDNIVNHLKTEILALGDIQRWGQRYSDHIRIIVMNLYNAASIDRSLYVAYSRNKKWYSNIPKDQPVTLRYDSMVNMVDDLMKLGYIEGVKGYYDRINLKNSRSAKMKATDKLIELCRAYSFSPIEIFRQQSKDVIILTEKDGNDKIAIPFEETKETHRMRINLNTINSELMKHFIGLNVSDDMLTEIKNATKGIKVADYDAYEDYYVEEIAYAREEKIKTGREDFKAPLDLSKNTLVRIFCNGTFVQGGRFYHGWWQAVPSKYRVYIAIDDKPTCEIDFAGIHINLLYLWEGLPIPTDDVYTIDSFPEGAKKVVRNVMKIALQVILNSKSEKDALWTISHHEKINRYANLFKIYTHKQIVEAFKEKHKAIEKYFYSGVGVHLQFEDSEIAEDILLSLIERGITALPIHDSFIVCKEHEVDLRAAMDHAVFKRYDQTLKLKADKTAFETDREFLAWNSSPEDVPISEEEYLAEYQSKKRYEYLSRRDHWYSERNI